MKKMLFIIIASGTLLAGNAEAQNERPRWSKEKAHAWSERHGWIRGSNFIPSSAVNQLEMWQKETFDPETIDRELSFAESIGFNAMRVFLHHLAWQEDPGGFKQRMNIYLKISDNSTGLKNRSEYSVRVANTNVWVEENGGMNDLKHQLTIGD